MMTKQQDTPNYHRLVIAFTIRMFIARVGAIWSSIIACKSLILNHNNSLNSCHLNLIDIWSFYRISSIFHKLIFLYKSIINRCVCWITRYLSFRKHFVADSLNGCLEIFAQTKVIWTFRNAINDIFLPKFSM